MSILRKVVVPISLAAITGMAQTAWADTTGATCEFYKHGEEKQKASGPCTFSQRQGYVNGLYKSIVHSTDYDCKQ